VPADTEVRVQRLCKEILAATTKAEVERIFPELHAALEEHIRRAKDSLKLQANTISPKWQQTEISKQPCLSHCP